MVRSILDIRIQKLFIITIILKIGSSFIGWLKNDPWILGFTVPLTIMLLYITVGHNRRDTDVTDEKFADSCYYLGFIFTITSIIFCLFDLPNIGTKIQDIAVRFGAAMVSTVFGLVVRVYLVSFKKDFADAVREAENAVIEASQRFREQLNIAFEKLCDFQSEVDKSAKVTVECVKMQVEALSKNHSERLTEFFIELTALNQDAFTQALKEVKSASLRLSDSVDNYSHGMRANLTSIEHKVTAFAEAVTDRLESTTFPDDFFAKNLSEPLAQLTVSANAISRGVNQAALEVKESTAVLATALKSLRSKATNTTTSLDKVISLTEQQQAVLENAQGQLTVLDQLTQSLTSFDTVLSNTLTGINNNNAVMSVLTTKVEKVVADGVETRKAMEGSLSTIAEKLETNSMATDAVAGKLDGVTAADLTTAKILSALGQQASTTIHKVDEAVTNMKDMVRQLSMLDAALRAQSTELKETAESIKDVKIIVELPPHINETVHRMGYQGASLVRTAITGQPFTPAETNKATFPAEIPQSPMWVVDHSPRNSENLSIESAPLHLRTEGIQIAPAVSFSQTVSAVQPVTALPKNLPSFVLEPSKNSHHGLIEPSTVTKDSPFSHGQQHSAVSPIQPKSDS